MSLINTHGIDCHIDTIVSATKSMGNSVFLIEHVLERQRYLCLVHGRDKMMLKNNGVASKMACHQEKTGTTKNHRLTYHRLKNMICEKNKCNDTFTIRHGMKRHAHEHHAYSIDATMHRNKRTRVAYPKLKQTPCNTKKSKSLSTDHVHVKKKDANKLYLKQLQDMPKNKCAICEEFHFSRNIRCFTEDLKEEYMSLTTNGKTFSSNKIYILVAKENFKMGNYHNLQHMTK